MTTALDQTSVLVIEDDQELNELLGEYLTLEKIRYVQALTGAAGLELAAREHPEAIILDAMLPDKHGFEIARVLSSHRATFDIPILMLTCMNLNCDRESALGAGVLYFANKPFLPDDLIALVHKALAWRERLGSRELVGRILVTTADPLAWMEQLRDMNALLFARTQLGDSAIGEIREAFETLAAWALECGKASGRDPQLAIDFKVVLAGGAATALEWTLSEGAPVLVAAVLSKPQAAASGGAMQSVFNSLAGTVAWAFGRSDKGEAKDGEKAQEKAPDAAGMGAKWMEFVAQLGAEYSGREAAAGQVKLVRRLTEETVAE